MYLQGERILLAVDEGSLVFLEGATLDYEDKMIRSMVYVQENPNAEASCSCKTSFSPRTSL